jgi:predicted phosphodiesterase
VRLALLSDVHGNAVALRAVLAALEQDAPDAVACLGDMIQGGVEPVAVSDVLLDRGWPVVLGNADAFLLDPDAGEEEVSEAQLEMRAWSLKQLGRERLDRIRAYTPTVELDLGEGRSFLGFHGSPTSYDDFLLPTTPEGVFRELLGGEAAEVMAGGHVHLQYLRRVGSSIFLNPGSIGLSHDHEQDGLEFRADPWAQYALVDLDGGRVDVSFRHVPFDPDDVIARIEASGRPGADAAAQMWRPRP